MTGLILESERLVLRKLTEVDFPMLCAVLQDIDVMYAWEHAFTDEEVRDWLRENLSRYETDGYSYWAVIIKETNEFSGVAGLLREEADGEEYVGIGYIFAKAFWHQGYASEAARACMEHAFHTLGIREVTAQIRPENLPSRRVAEKLGMIVKKEFIRHYRGKEMPHLLYSKLREKEGR